MSRKKLLASFMSVFLISACGSLRSIAYAQDDSGSGFDTPGPIMGGDIPEAPPTPEGQPVDNGDENNTDNNNSYNNSYHPNNNYNRSYNYNNNYNNNNYSDNTPTISVSDSDNNQGVDYFNNKDYVDAYADFMAAMQVEPNAPLYRRNAALAAWGEAQTAYNNGDWAGAINLYNNALALFYDDPNDRKLILHDIASAEIMLGNEFYKNKDYADAISLYQEAITLDNDPADVATFQQNIANAQWCMGNDAWSKADWAGAIAQYQKALALDNNPADQATLQQNIANATWNQGNDADNKGDWAAAIQQYQNALNSPDSAPADKARFQSSLEMAQTQLKNATTYAAAVAAQAKVQAENTQAVANIHAQITQLSNNLTAGGGATLNFDSGSGASSASSSSGLNFIDASTVDLSNAPTNDQSLPKQADEIEKSPGAPEADKGWQCVAKDDWSAALVWYQMALQKDPQNAALQRMVDMSQYMVNLRYNGPVMTGDYGNAVKDWSNNDPAAAEKALAADHTTAAEEVVQVMEDISGDDAAIDQSKTPVDKPNQNVVAPTDKDLELLFQSDMDQTGKTPSQNTTADPNLVLPQDQDLELLFPQDNDSHLTLEEVEQIARTKAELHTQQAMNDLDSNHLDDAIHEMQIANALTPQNQNYKSALQYLQQIKADDAKPNISAASGAH